MLHPAAGRLTRRRRLTPARALAILGGVRRASFAATALAVLLASGPLTAAESHYDLGGPCQDNYTSNLSGEIREAKQNRNWDRAIALEKINVRQMCRNQYRWFELVSTLLAAQRPAEALRALEAMDSREFNLTAEAIGDTHPGVKEFMDSAGFRESELGGKIERWKRESDARRASYRELLNHPPPGLKPPGNYIAKGACPFECCQYRKWTVIDDTDLVDAPGSTTVVGRAVKGSRVDGLTGEVHLRPEPVLVLKDGELPKDTIAFLLDYGGEGYYNVYTRGKTISTSVAVARYCFHVSDECWGERLQAPGEGKVAVWWVKIKLPNGVIGWTDKSAHFGNMDACG
jgi:hypothetical protein